MIGDIGSRYPQWLGRRTVPQKLNRSRAQNGVVLSNSWIADRLNLVARYEGRFLLRLHHERLLTVADEESSAGLLKYSYATHSHPSAGDLLGREWQQVRGMADWQLR